MAIFSLVQGLLISMSSHPGLALLPPGVLTRAHAHNMLMRARLIASQSKNQPPMTRQYHPCQLNISKIDATFLEFGFMHRSVILIVISQNKYYLHFEFDSNVLKSTMRKKQNIEQSTNFFLRLLSSIPNLL